MCWIARACSDRGVLWTIENPANSWFWYLPPVIELLGLPGVIDTVHHACMHGGARKKLQRWRGNFTELRELDRLCDGGHEHAPWTRVVECVCKAAVRLGKPGPRQTPLEPEEQETNELRAARLVAGGVQPRRLGPRQLVPESKEERSMLVKAMMSNGH